MAQPQDVTVAQPQDNDVTVAQSRDVDLPVYQSQDVGVIVAQSQAVAVIVAQPQSSDIPLRILLVLPNKIVPLPKAKLEVRASQKSPRRKFPC